MSQTRQQAKLASHDKVTKGEPIPPPRKKKKSNSALSNIAGDSKSKR